jgi:hypothetical protein
MESLAEVGNGTLSPELRRDSLIEPLLKPATANLQSRVTVKVLGTFESRLKKISGIPLSAGHGSGPMRQDKRR